MEQQVNRALMLAALSDELLRGQFIDAWRSIFLGKNSDCVDFVCRPFAVLCADAPPASDAAETADSLAATYGGSVQAARQVDIAIAFDAPAVAMRAALALQRLAPRRRLRCAIVSGNQCAARVLIDGTERTIILEQGVAAAERHALTTPPGSIHVCAETYGLLDETCEHELSSAMVSAEMLGDQVDSAMFTLPPAASSEMSTFAGLGRM